MQRRIEANFTFRDPQIDNKHSETKKWKKRKKETPGKKELRVYYNSLGARARLSLTGYKLQYKYKFYAFESESSPSFTSSKQYKQLRFDISVYFPCTWDSLSFSLKVFYSEVQLCRSTLILLSFVLNVFTFLELLFSSTYKAIFWVHELKRTYLINSWTSFLFDCLVRDRHHLLFVMIFQFIWPQISFWENFFQLDCLLL